MTCREACKLRGASTCSFAETQFFLAIRVRKWYIHRVYAARASRRVFQRPLFFSGVAERWKVHSLQIDEPACGHEMIYLCRGTKLHLRSLIQSRLFTGDLNSMNHDFLPFFFYARASVCTRPYKVSRALVRNFLFNLFDPRYRIYKHYLLFELCLVPR